MNKLTGVVPPLPFAQYCGDERTHPPFCTCHLDAPVNSGCACTEPQCNHFSCPLPANSEKCTWASGEVGVQCK
jgi:hypothetical protein